MTATRSILLAGLTALAGLPSGAVTLDECIREALEANPGLEAAVKRVEAAGAAVGEARSGWYPMVTLAGSYARTDNPPQAFFMSLNQRQASLAGDFNNPDDTENFRGSIGFRMLLADGGQRGLDIDLSRLGESASRDLLDAARNELVHEVTRAYYTVAQAEAMADVQEATLESIQGNLRVAQERYTAGSAVKTDVLNLEVQEADARENLIRARNRVRLARAALNTAIGREMVDAGGMDTPDVTDLPPPPESVDPADAVQRPELLGTSKQVEAAGLAYTKTRRDNLPRLMAYGSLDWDSDSTSDFEESYLVGAALEWDLFTGFRRGHASAAAKARHDEARARERELADRLRLDLTQAHFNALEAWERIDVAAQSTGSADEALRITRERYEQGAADITELLTAQVGATAARTRLVMARYDYLIALSNLDRARGLLVAAAATTN